MIIFIGPGVSLSTGQVLEAAVAGVAGAEKKVMTRISMSQPVKTSFKNGSSAEESAGTELHRTQLAWPVNPIGMDWEEENPLQLRSSGGWWSRNAVLSHGQGETTTLVLGESLNSALVPIFI